MKLKVLKTEIKRSKNITTCYLTVALNDNGKIVKPSIKTFVGEAKCHDEPYDYKTGKRISLARAEIKAYKYFKEGMKNAMKVSKRFYDESSKLHDKFKNQIAHNKLYLKDIVSGSNS